MPSSAGPPPSVPSSEHRSPPSLKPCRVLTAEEDLFLVNRPEQGVFQIVEDRIPNGYFDGSVKQKWKKIAYPDLRLERCISRP
ncbi:hypothetical protein PIB30_049103 [Stylosanthes scabra]|uniref:Uncharacterized protein n=1 Tax=Stylosanthes scabra TaxID=79078 RepID=A0ABU6SHG7_9FABA|nr:hypothetical protein [Stylosanthes scabra]